MNNKVIKLNYIKDINDPIKLEESVISYLKDYDLESLLKINKYGIEDILIKNISNNILLFDSEDNLLVLKKYNYKNMRTNRKVLMSCKFNYIVSIWYTVFENKNLY